MTEPRAVYQVRPDDTCLSADQLKELACLRDALDPGYEAPSVQAIRSVFADSSWTQARVAELLKVNVSTVRRWTTPEDESEHRPIPYASWRLLLLLSGLVPLTLESAV